MISLCSHTLLEEVLAAAGARFLKSQLAEGKHEKHYKIEPNIIKKSSKFVYQKCYKLPKPDQKLLRSCLEAPLPCRCSQSPCKIKFTWGFVLIPM